MGRGGVQSFSSSTALLAKRDQLDFWRDALARAAVPLEVRTRLSASSPPGSFAASMDATTLGDVRFLATRSDNSYEVLRTPRLIAASTAEAFTLFLHLAGTTRTTLGEHHDVHRPGSVMLMDSGQPNELILPDNHEALTVHFPLSALHVPRDRLRSLCMTELTTDSGVGLLLRPFLLQVARQLHQDETPALPDRLADTVVQLVESFVWERLGTTTGGGGTPAQVLLFQIRRDIDNRLGWDDLNPTQLAERHHISLRYLHKLFADADTTVAAWIKERRLQRANRDLRDRSLDHLPVSVIAAGVGLPNPAQFSRLFKARFGMTPSDYRRQERARDDLEPPTG